jgi:protein-L-isoaspartate(D-aspartate) O-methyltransferase
MVSAPRGGGRIHRAEGQGLAAHLFAAGVRDDRVLTAVAKVPRDLFVPSEYRRFAWDNAPLPIGAGQTISAPLVVARMCELLELTGGYRVLDVGTGSGYHAALLSRLADHVWSIERRPELSRQAQANLRSAGIDNVTLVVGDGTLGLPQDAPYDAINVAAAAPASLLAGLEDQLGPEGRLVAPVDGYDQRLVLARRTDGDIERQAFEAVRFVPLALP